MLSDEEKKVMDELWHFDCAYNREIKIVLNLIEKQSKEIEDNKKYIDLHYVPYEQYTSKLNELNKKWKDKIKAKIEEMNKDFKEYENGQEWEIQDEIRGQIEVLQSLLEKE